MTLATAGTHRGVPATAGTPTKAGMSATTETQTKKNRAAGNSTDTSHRRNTRKCDVIVEMRRHEKIVISKQEPSATAFSYTTEGRPANERKPATTGKSATAWGC